MPALILGATGNVGPHVVAELVASGEQPRVLVRDGDRARDLLGDTADIVSGDVTAPGVVEEAAEGMDSLFLLSPHSFGMADLQLGVIRALRRRDIRIIKLSGTSSAITPDGPHVCRQHWEVEQVLVRSGQPYVILRPNSYMQVLIGRLMLPALQATGTVTNPIAEAGISLVDARDVGAVAAGVLTDHRWDGQTLSLTGPRSVTYAEIATWVGDIVGNPTRVVDVTPAEVRERLVASGTADWEADHFAEMYDLFRAGESEFVTDTVEQVTQRPARTVEAFLDEVLQPAGAAR